MVGEVGLEPTKAKANGFTVRPLCRSGHSPVPRLETADENAPGDPRRYPGELSGAARTPVNWKMTRRLWRPTLAPAHSGPLVLRFRSRGGKSPRSAGPRPRNHRRRLSMKICVIGAGAIGGLLAAK